MRLPRKLTGTDSRTVEWNAAVDYARSLVLSAGPGLTVQREPHGTTIAGKTSGGSQSTSSGRRKAVTAYKGWHGAEGFLSDNCVGTDCPRRNLYKYRTRSVTVSEGFLITTKSCCPADGAWEHVVSNYGYEDSTHSTVNTIQINTGQPTASGTCTDGDPLISGGFPAEGCGSALPNAALIPLGPSGCPGSTRFAHLWANLTYSCGLFSPVGCVGGAQWPGGSVSDMIAYFGSSDVGATSIDISAPTDDGTTSEIHIHIAWDITDGSDVPCPDTPPAEGAGCECKYTRMTGHLDVDIVLSNPYTWEDCYSDAISLVNSVGDDCENLGPQCDTYGQIWQIVTRKEIDGAEPEALCSYTTDPAFDGSIVVGGDDGVTATAAWYWVLWDSNLVGVQKWLQKRGHFKGYNWQADNPSTGQYLLLQQFTDACTGTQTNLCELRVPPLPPTDCDQYYISFPDASDLTPHIHRAAPSQIMWQGWIKPAFTDPFRADPPQCWVEPNDCDSGCPGERDCNPPPFSSPPSRVFEHFPCLSSCPGPDNFPGEPGNTGDGTQGSGTGGCEC